MNIVKSWCGLFAISILFFGVNNSFAANECKIYYKYKIGNSTRGSYLNINSGQTKNINKNQVLYVQNKKNRSVKVKLTRMTITGASGTKWVTLPKSPDRDPASGFGDYPPNVKLYQANCPASNNSSNSSSTNFATPQALVNALKASNVAVKQIALQLKSNFNKNGKQIIQLLKSSGFSIEIIIKGVGDALNANTSTILVWLKQSNYTAYHVVKAFLKLKSGITNKNCNRNDCKIVAGWFKLAQFPSRDTLRALTSNFNLTPQASFNIATDVFNLTGQVLTNTLRYAGLTAARIAALIAAANNAAGNVVSQTRNSTNRAIARAMDLRFVLHGTGFLNCNQAPGYTKRFGISTYPNLPLPNNNRRFSVTFLGNEAMAGATRINGLPRGIRATISQRGPCYIVVDFVVPPSVRAGRSGTASIISGTTMGPRFRFVTGGRIPSVGGYRTPPRTSSGGLSIVLDRNLLFRVGTATTTDSNNRIYTALKPFSNSVHCVGRAQPNPPNIPSGELLANRGNVTIRNIVWGVINRNSAARQNVTVRLLGRNNRVLAEETIANLNPRQTRTFTYTRPNNRACLAKVGAGNGCYVCGRSNQTWNDNDVKVEIR